MIQKITEYEHVNYQEYCLPVFRAPELEVDVYIWNNYNK